MQHSVSDTDCCTLGQHLSMMSGTNVTVEAMPASDFQAPQGSLVRRELRAVREPGRLLLRSPQLLRAPAGNKSVMVMPGFSTNDSAMLPLRSYLRGRGHTVWGWGLGTNRGHVRKNLPTVIQQVETRVGDNDGVPIVLVGWSLGGVFAREVARDRPELVEQVITLASPIYGGPRYTVSASSYSESELDKIEEQIDERLSRLITRPITAFYSQQDGAVDWRTCIDDLNPDVETTEVNSSHVGITLDPTVWLRIADLLAS